MKIGISYNGLRETCEFDTMESVMYPLDKLNINGECSIYLDCEELGVARKKFTYLGEHSFSNTRTARNISN